LVTEYQPREPAPGKIAGQKRIRHCESFSWLLQAAIHVKLDHRDYDGLGKKGNKSNDPYLRGYQFQNTKTILAIDPDLVTSVKKLQDADATAASATA